MLGYLFKVDGVHVHGVPPVVIVRCGPGRVPEVSYCRSALEDAVQEPSVPGYRALSTAYSLTPYSYSLQPERPPPPSL